MTSVAAENLRQILDRAGLDAMHSLGSPVSRHTLFMPIGLVVARDEDGDEAIEWSAIEEKAIDADSTGRCLWDFVALRDPALADIRSFIEKWGLIDFPESEHDPGRLDYPELLDAASEVRSAVLLISATEAGELVSERLLDPLKRWEEFPVDAFAELQRRGEPMSSLLYHAVRLEKLREHWRAERTSGRGLDLQRRLLTNFMNGWVRLGAGYGPSVQPLELEVTWDDGGRRVDWLALGARAIVGSHLLSILAAPQIDVFTCSVCGSPFPFDPIERHRRPKAGRRQLCSTACKDEARRADNRASWHKNKSKWSRSVHKRQGG